MRLAAYTGTSMVLATGVVIQALHQRANFYSACVYLAQSNACLMILTNLVLLCVCAVMVGLQRLFYGPLRPIEIEQLYEKAWFAITETCLAMTIFREEVGGWFLVMFVSLLIGKVWGWIGEGRVDVLEQQPPANPRLFHARLSFSLFLSIAYGLYMLDYSVTTVLRQARPNMMVMFAFEFAVLTITSSSTAARYAISLREAYIIKVRTREKLEERRAELRVAREEGLRRAATQDGTANAENSGADVPDEENVEEMDIDVPGWEEKGRWVFYLNLTTDFLKLIVYLSFFAILFMFYGLPIHIMRDVFLTLRSFFKRITDFLRYRNATRDMNERYPDATAEEIGREDVCIICREEMRPWQQPDNEGAPGREGLRPARHPARTVDERLRPKKLPCGHVLHFGCLRSWLERQQICPTCRRPVLVTNRFRVVPANAPALNNVNQPIGGQAQQIQLRQPQAGLLGQAAEDQAPGGQNRARVLNFGPFRIALGQAQGNLFQDQVHLANNGPVGQQPANPGAPQQYGFTFGFQRPQANPPHGSAAQFSPPGVHAQLHQIEQQIMQEINSLRASADQMTMVRALQGELARLRITQANPGAGLGGVPPIVAPTGYGTRQIQPPAQMMQTPPTMQVYGPIAQMPAMGAGHQDLVPGLALPEGWTVLPLQRIQQDPVTGQARPLQSQHLQSHPPHRPTDPSPRPASMSVQVSSRFGAASSPSGLPQPPLARGMSGSNVPGRGDSFVAPQTSSTSTDRIVPQAQTDQISTLPEASARPECNNASDVERSSLAAREQNDTPSRGYDNTVDGEGSAYGTPSAGTPEIDQPSLASIPIWGTGAQPEQVSHKDNANEADAASGTAVSNLPEPINETEPTELAQKRQAKGKSRAATVEDFIDDVD